MIIFEDKKDCCGCTACENVCPKCCIEMISDNEGFQYPKINSDSCIECGLCKKVCTFQSEYDTSDNLNNVRVYGVKHKSSVVRENSRSGGAFTSFSDFILDYGGVVYGAAFNKEFQVQHIRVENKFERDQIRGSKYVQSQMNDVFKLIKKDLIEDRLVLFSGTPCHTAALRQYLKVIKCKNINNLYLCDIVCHGVPSPALWEDYIKFIEKKYKGSIQYINFRDKKYGWDSHYESFKINNREYKSDYFTSIFYDHSCLRPACYNCKYTNTTRPSDITLADFWGIDRVDSRFNDNKGVSLVLINSKKGEQLFNTVKEELNYIRSELSDCMQPNLQYPTKQPNSRDYFWTTYENGGIESLIRICTFKRKVDRANNKIKGSIVRALKKLK